MPDRKRRREDRRCYKCNREGYIAANYPAVGKKVTWREHVDQRKATHLELMEVCTHWARSIRSSATSSSENVSQSSSDGEAEEPTSWSQIKRRKEGAESQRAAHKEGRSQKGNPNLRRGQPR